MNNHAWLYLSIFMASTCVLAEGSSLRLVGGTFPREGRVEMISPRAGTVCDDSWSDSDAKVVCRMLGYLSTQYSPVALTKAYYGEGAGSIVLDDVGCSGSEADILMCSHRNISNCIHAEDAGVNCFHGRGGLGLNIMLSLVIVIITCRTKDKTSKTPLDSSGETNQACTDLTETRPRYEVLQDMGRSTTTIERPDESLYANMVGL